MMQRLARIAVLALIFPAAAFAQEPDPDAEGCTSSKVLARMPGCFIHECDSKDFDEAAVVVDKTGTTKTLEGAVEQQRLVCSRKISQLQVLRNAENALKSAGFTTVFSGKHEQADFPAVTAQKGPQWVFVQTDQWNEFAAYSFTAVLVKGMTQEMTAGAQAIADAIGKTGRLDVYGITFATGQATITPQSDQVLSDVLAVLVANPDWAIRIEGHTDNVGDKAANQKLSEARARAVIAWLSGKGVDATRLSAAGFGDAQPVADNKTDEGRAKNRRVVLVKQ